jgi:hypothetical protein
VIVIDTYEEEMSCELIMRSLRWLALFADEERGVALIDIQNPDMKTMFFSCVENHTRECTPFPAQNTDIPARRNGKCYYIIESNDPG